MDHAVDPAVLLAQLLDQLSERRGIANVELVVFHASSVGTDRVEGLTNLPRREDPLRVQLDRRHAIGLRAASREGAPEFTSFERCELGVLGLIDGRSSDQMQGAAKA